MGQCLDVGLLVSEETATGTSWIGESAGSVPGKEEIAGFREKGDLRFSQVIMGIGQGPISWTPVQAANAYATLARGGPIRDATLVMNDPRGPRTKRCDDLKLSNNLVAAALEGLRQSVEERHGTGHHINHDGGASEPIINAVDVKVSAKTGTAQAPPLRLKDTTGDGKINGDDAISYKSLDHSWFVGLAGPRHSPRPLHAIAVLVEYGGSGGRCAGPIANQIIRALQAEGYLPGDPAAAPGGPSAVPAGEPEYGEDH
jgi:penicillin-binding protein 2